MDGILIGADQTQEWLLPWWWGHYRKSNAYPVAFIDFGLSFEKKAWCRQKGTLIPLRVCDFATEKEQMAPKVVKQLEAEFGPSFWDCRNTWFKKPLACLTTPFQRTLWIDLDCEVRGSLKPLFPYADSGPAMAKEQSDAPLPYQVYNSGVIAFRKNEPLIKQWAEACRHRNDVFRGDQEVFSWMVANKKIAITELPPHYNWSRCQPDNEEAVIQHWHGVYGKCVIRNQISEE